MKQYVKYLSGFIYWFTLRKRMKDKEIQNRGDTKKRAQRILKKKRRIKAND